MLHKRWRAESVMRLYVPGGQLQGRAAAMRVKQGQADFTVAGLYFPPRKAMQAYRQTVQGLADWTEHLLGSLPRRTTPIVGMDLNDGRGVKLGQGGAKEPVVSTAVGTATVSVEHWASEVIRGMAEVHDMAFCDTFFKHGPTYYGDGSRSYTEHLMVPKGVLNVYRHAPLLWEP